MRIAVGISRLGLSTKMLLMGAALSIWFPIPLLTLLLPELKSDRYAMQAEATKHVAEAAWGVLNYYGKQAASGAMTVPQAQLAARETVRQARYDGTNYVWINDLHPTMIMHPANPALEGQDLSNYRDPKGLALFVKARRDRTAAGRRRAAVYVAQTGSHRARSKDFLRQAVRSLGMGGRHRRSTWIRRKRWSTVPAISSFF